MRRHPTRTSRRGRVAACLAALALASAPGCGDEGDGLEKHPVRGTVLVNGEPAELMAVTFHKTDGGATGNAARPVAVTDARGEFSLSTNADKDGAVAGEYDVTFYWASENGPSAYDRLGGRFANPNSSAYHVRVEPKANDLEPLRLEVDARKLRPPRKPSLPQ